MGKAYIKSSKYSIWILIAAIVGLLCFGSLSFTGAQVVEPLLPDSLKDVVVPEPTNLYAFLKGNPNGTNEEQAQAGQAKQIAIVLGKLLFWDMQVGSDDVQACASCHFNAGADVRTKNQLTPIDEEFGNPSEFVPLGTPGHPNFAPNMTVVSTDFPFHTRFPATEAVDPLDPVAEFDTLVRDTNDVMSSQGVRENDSPTTDPPDPIFNWKGANQRKVEPRNAPSMVNAVFHLDMFWDGRASAIFNGVNPFGFRDPDSTLIKNDPVDGLQDVFVRIPLASHASQSVGPPLSTLEMSGFMRSFPELAEKLLDLNPLKFQMVHPQDSVLGPYANANYALNKQGKQTGKINNVPGTKNPVTGDVLTYRKLIEQAFKEEWWNGGENQVKHNFSLFFGLAMQLYQGTLVADDTPFDRFMGANANVRGNAPIAPNPNALTQQEKLGLDLFQGTNFSGQNPELINAGCNNCHFLPESSNHVVRLAGMAPPEGVVNDPLDPVNVLAPQTVLELMPMGDGNLAVYDIGFYNIAVRPTEEDIGRAGKAFDLPFSYVELAFMKFNKDPKITDEVAPFVPDGGIVEVVQPDGTVVDVPVDLEGLFGQNGANGRFVTRGAFKVPTLRNQEFQGPYFHNGGDATLRQVVEFYARGGNFPATNIAHFDADIMPIPELDVGNPDPAVKAQAEVNIQALVAFLSRGLTDPRVANERAPFDHPQLFIPEGVTGAKPDLDKMKEIKATGANGAGTIPRFLGLNPQAQ